jgi:hypothetical protein
MCGLFYPKADLIDSTFVLDASEQVHIQSVFKRHPQLLPEPV